ncbi:MAG: VanW family protein [Weeksellaceae bacterium]
MKKKHLLTIPIILALSTLVFSLLFITYQNHKLANRIYPQTSVDSIDLSYKTKDEALRILNKKNEQYPQVAVEVIYKDEKIATFSGKTLNIRRNVSTVVDQAYMIGRSPHAPSRVMQQLTSIFNLKKYDFPSSLEYDTSPINEFVSKSEESYNRPAKNALFTFEDGKVTSFKADEKGLKIKSNEFLQNIDKTIQEADTGKILLFVTLQDTVIDPEITLAKANDQGIEELVGEGISDYSGSIPSRIHNLKLATSKFNGVIIPKDSIFSFNEIIGDISALTGYQPAYVIKNGRTVLGDGGGVCQVSTTVFRAALNSGVEIVERNAHAYRVSYYENDSKPGFDATIYTPSVDFTFKNNTPGSILIQTAIDEENNILSFKFYGKKDDRKIEISPVSVWDIAPPPEPLYQDDPTLPSGVVKQVDYPAWGAKATFNYRVSKDNAIMYERDFYSAYRPWQAVYLRGTGQAI